MTIIDVSKWQGVINWDKVRAAGVECAIIRCAMGATGVDERYAENWGKSAKAGIPRRGTYFYVVTEAPAAEQVDNIMRVTQGDFGSEPLTLDCERRADERLLSFFHRAAYTALVREMLDRLAGVVGLRIYTSKNEWNQITTQPAWASDYPLWVAAYPFDPDSPTYKPPIPAQWPTWSMWQYSSTGSVPGIDGDVDLSRERLAPIPQPQKAPIVEAMALIDRTKASLESLL